MTAMTSSESDLPPHLQVVPHVPEGSPHQAAAETGEVTVFAQRAAPTKLADFEGQRVAYTTGKISSVGDLDLGNAVFGVDEVVKCIVEVQVAGVHYDVDKEGQLVRVHRLKAKDAVVVEWDLDIESLRGR